jgi:hypothetical protein
LGDDALERCRWVKGSAWLEWRLALSARVVGGRFKQLESNIFVIVKTF